MRGPYEGSPEQRCRGLDFKTGPDKDGSSRVLGAMRTFRSFVQLGLDSAFVGLGYLRFGHTTAGFAQTCSTSLFVLRVQGVPRRWQGYAHFVLSDSESTTAMAF